MTAAGRIAAALLWSLSIGLLPPVLMVTLTALGLSLLLVGLQAQHLRQVLTRALVAIGALLAVLLPLLVAAGDAALPIAARATAVVLGVLALTAAVTAQRLGPALRGLYFPRSISAVVAAIARQLGALQVESRRMLLARRLRGARGVQLGPTVVADLFERSLTRAQQQDLAARIRGIDLLELDAHAPVRKDWAWLALLAVAVVALQVWGRG